MGLAKFLFSKVFGWKIDGDFDRAIKKSVLICAPHTSYFDFIISVLARRILKVEINYVAKKELFAWPIGWYFRWTGGAPLNRGKAENKVEAIAAVIKSKEEFRLALAPEGTRKKVETWKSGYYYISLAAGVPIIPVGFDYPSKTMYIGEAFYPSGDIAIDEPKLKLFYKDIVGRVAAWS